MPTFDGSAKRAASDVPLFWKRAMRVNAQQPRHSFEAQFVASQADSGKVTKGEAIEPSLASKSREAWSGSGGHPAKECLVCMIETFECASLKGYWQSRSIGVALAPFGESSALVHESSRDPCLSKGVDPFFQGCVIELPLGLQDGFQSSVLFLRRKQPKCVSNYQAILLDGTDSDTGKAHQVS
jgi:hypothetical protein